jgi:hypothetical protein
VGSNPTLSASSSALSFLNLLRFRFSSDSSSKRSIKDLQLESAFLSLTEYESGPRERSAKTGDWKDEFNWYLPDGAAKADCCPKTKMKNEERPTNRQRYRPFVVEKRDSTSHCGEQFNNQECVLQIGGTQWPSQPIADVKL